MTRLQEQYELMIEGLGQPHTPDRPSLWTAEMDRMWRIYGARHEKGAEDQSGSADDFANAENFRKWLRGQIEDEMPSEDVIVDRVYDNVVERVDRKIEDEIATAVRDLSTRAMQRVDEKIQTYLDARSDRILMEVLGINQEQLEQRLEDGVKNLVEKCLDSKAVQDEAQLAARDRTNAIVEAWFKEGDKMHDLRVTLMKVYQQALNQFIADALNIKATLKMPTRKIIAAGGGE